MCEIKGSVPSYGIALRRINGSVTAAQRVIGQGFGVELRETNPFPDALLTGLSTSCLESPLPSLPPSPPLPTLILALFPPRSPTLRHDIDGRS